MSIFDLIMEKIKEINKRIELALIMGNEVDHEKAKLFLAEIKNDIQKIKKEIKY
jgi:hypothetical protein